MEKKIFWTRFAIYMAVSLVAPIVYLSIRFKLFSKTTSVSVSFWFIVVVLIILAMIVGVVKFYLDGMKTKFSYLKQVLQGLIKIVMPIGIILLLMIWFKDKIESIALNINSYIEAVSIILGCEFAGIFINPLPKWAFDNNVEGLVQIGGKILNKE